MLFCLAHQRRLECETEPDYNKLPPSRIGRFVSQLRAALFKVCLSVGDDSLLLFWRFPVLSWAKGRLKCIEKPLHHSLAPPFLPLTPSLPFSPPLESPLVIFPTHQPIIVPYVSGRSDLIGCVGGVWEVRPVFILHCVLLDSLQQHPQSTHTDSRRRKVARWGRKEGKEGDK